MEKRTDHHPLAKRNSRSQLHKPSDVSHRRGPGPGVLHLFSLFSLALLTLFAPGPAVAQTDGCNRTNTTHPMEVTALRSVFEGFNGTGAVNLPGWGSQADPCSQGGSGAYGSAGVGWAGVVCQKTINGGCTTTVTGLQLMDMQIQGNLSSQIQALKNLTTIILSGNPELTGLIPQEISNLSDLVTLDLHGNAFIGSIPNLQNLHRLQFLDLSSNQMGGPIPGWLGTLSQLQKLDLSNNLLRGTLPLSVLSNETGLNNLTFAVHMSFSNNHLFGGLDELSSLSKLRKLNGSHNHFNSTFPDPLLQTQNMPLLKTLDLSSNDFTGSMPDVTISGLQEIYVANNSLSGSLPSGFVNSSSLQVLNLDFNQISGTLNLDLLSSNSTLQMISLVNNNITEVQLSNTTSLQSAATTPPLNNLFLGGNPYCNNPQMTLQLQICRSYSNEILTNRQNQTTTTVAATTSKRNNNRLMISLIVAAATAGVVVLLASLVTLFIFKRLSPRVHNTQKEFAIPEKVQPNLYSYSELKIATQDFASEMRVGQGGFGIVYKGILPNDTQVAVKQLNNSELALADFLNEVVTLNNVRHRNLVKLKGCCVKGDQRLLVYEYIENQNLAEALWDAPSKGGQRLEWATRFNIILGIARGLAYLHEEVNPPIIHRDIKAANILLDKDMTPKIGDFGLALLYPALDEDRTHLSANIAGTKGYLSPEYASLGQVSEKADVFSFGILVLEIISGRKNINLRLPAEQRYILEWAWKLYEDETLTDFVDAELADRSKEEDMKQVIKLGLACVQFSAARRPSMSQVVSILLGSKALDTINRDCELSKGELESMIATMQTSALTPVDEDSPLLVGLPTASASGAFIELGKLKPR